MKSKSSVMINWAASDPIMAAIQVLTFFFESISIFFYLGHLHMCERAFSALTNLKTKYSSRLNVKSDLQICLSQMTPRIDELCKVKQAHLSH